MKNLLTLIKSFTFIEWFVIVAILALIAGIVWPALDRKHSVRNTGAFTRD